MAGKNKGPMGESLNCGARADAKPRHGAHALLDGCLHLGQGGNTIAAYAR